MLHLSHMASLSTSRSIKMCSRTIISFRYSSWTTKVVSTTMMHSTTWWTKMISKTWAWQVVVLDLYCRSADPRGLMAINSHLDRSGRKITQICPDFSPTLSKQQLQDWRMQVSATFSPIWKTSKWAIYPTTWATSNHLWKRLPTDQSEVRLPFLKRNHREFLRMNSCSEKPGKTMEQATS